jgi:hypothetical protein
MGLKLGQPLKRWLHKLPPATPSEALQNDSRIGNLACNQALGGFQFSRFS